MKRSQNTCRRNVFSDFWDEEMAVFLCVLSNYTVSVFPREQIGGRHFYYDYVFLKDEEEEYADAAYDSQHYLADQMVAISLGVESMFYPYNIEDFTDWSFRSGNGAFSYDTWFTLKNK